ncbi:hypothetical protein KIN20_001165 [Parelaphostrongylus tenuis]|uniref:Uncharacterized protein n=1 Tax=Parelaphostrongylus tenuis TaxID=148309 RepID=A0AAD5QG26_PARTN|nr:hypothetical protein KIN20_001165 [Parelaphostrongylus tenuis]
MAAIIDRVDGGHMVIYLALCSQDSQHEIVRQLVRPEQSEIVSSGRATNLL